MAATWNHVITIVTFSGCFSRKSMDKLAEKVPSLWYKSSPSWTLPQPCTAHTGHELPHAPSPTLEYCYAFMHTFPDPCYTSLAPPHWISCTPSCSPHHHQQPFTCLLDCLQAVCDLQLPVAFPIDFVMRNCQKDASHNDHEIQLIMATRIAGMQLHFTTTSLTNENFWPICFGMILTLRVKQYKSMCKKL